MRANTTLRLGTRGSLLARAQSRLIADELRARLPDIDVMLVPLETRGDRDLRVPLADVDDAGFFSAELDEALLRGDVDFCVHSLKDLPREPGRGIARVALPARADPRDVIVFRGDIAERARNGERIRIGSSSRRRELNVGRFLPGALPHGDHEPSVDFLPLRGPVDKRLQPVNRDPGDPEALDGVILALAGLARLWDDPDGRQAIAPLLRDKRWMVLPLGECPAAPGQGALALECRAQDTATREILTALHDDPTARLIARELSVIDTVPAHARAAGGATSLHVDPLGPVTFYTRPGARPGLHWLHPPKPERAVAWDGLRLTGNGRDEALRLAPDVLKDRALFVAHWRAVTPAVNISDPSRIWVSGVRSWRQLARGGFWVEGCADNLGFNNITRTLQTGVLQLPRLSRWAALTSEESAESWRDSGVGRIIASYRHGEPSAITTARKLRKEISAATHFFWGSAHQYRAAAAWLPARAQHSCGPGKTADSLRRLGVQHLASFPSRKAWQEWLA